MVTGMVSDVWFIMVVSEQEVIRVDNPEKWGYGDSLYHGC
jgi:hypothetical protein